MCSILMTVCHIDIKSQEKKSHNMSGQGLDSSVFRGCFKFKIKAKNITFFRYLDKCEIF